MAPTSRRGRAPVALFAGFVSLSAWLGAIGMVSGLLPVGHILTLRMPFHSPVFGGVALAMVVAAPVTAGTVLTWRRNPSAGAAVTLSGLLLIGWIAVETAVVRQYSPLQLIFLVAGVGLVVVGDHATVRAVGAVLAAARLFLTAPVYRRWHLRWGATGGEIRAPMSGDQIVPAAQFTATRALTIDAPPEAVWPWLVQVGFGRAGFYSYDLLDNLGRHSAGTLLLQWQHPVIGAVAAPMTNPATTATSFVVADIESPQRLVWAKPDSSWSWLLHRLPDGRTRLITRLRQRYRRRLGTLVTIVLIEFGDFPMMRAMLIGIKKRAEEVGSRTIRRPATATVRDRIELYWLPLDAGGHLVHWNGRIYEAFAARHRHRPTQALYHAALQVHSAGVRYVIEMAPVWSEAAPDRGVTCEGPVGMPGLGRFRAFRYEVRRWPDGRIADVDAAVASPQLMGTDPHMAKALLEAVGRVPVFTWGRDEFGCGDMWNSNSLVSWLLAYVGVDTTGVGPPHGGRAPGWRAGLTAAGTPAHRSILKEVGG